MRGDVGDAGGCGGRGGSRFDLWVRKIPWRRKWQPTAAFLPGKSYGQRSLAGCRPWGRKESDTTEHARRAHGGKVHGQQGQKLLETSALKWQLAGSPAAAASSQDSHRCT